MSLLDTLGNSAVKALGGALGGGAAQMGFDALNNPENSRRENRKNFHQDMEQQWTWDVKKANLGRDIDVGSQQEMFDFRLNRAKEAGLTNVEAFGSPAAGGGGGTGAATSTLGNSAASSGAQMRQSAMQAKIAATENQKNRMTSLAQTAMQTDAQKEVAGINAGVTERGQDIQKAIAQGRLELDRDSYNMNMELAAANINKTEQETAKLINEVATSDKKFVVLMKQLSMGAENMLVEYYQRHHGISLSDPESFTALPKEKREQLLAAMLAMTSGLYKEGSAVEALGNKVTAKADPIANPIADLIANLFPTGEGIESTNAPPNKKRGFTPPKSYKKRGYAGPQPFKTY